MQEEEVLGKAYDARLMRRLLRYLVPYRGVIAIALGLILLESLAEVAFPWLTRIAIDEYIAPGDLDGLLGIAVAYVAILVARLGVSAVETYLLQSTGQRIMFDMRQQIFGHLQTLPNSFYDRNPVGRLLTRVTTDVDVLNEMFSAGLVSVFGDILILAGISIALVVMDWRLGLIVLAIVPFIAVTTAVFRYRARDGYRRVRTAVAKINAFLQEHITGMSVVQLYNREAKSARAFDRINREHLRANLDSIMAYAVFYPVVELLTAVCLALIVWYGGARVLGGTLTLGVLVAFFQYALRFFRPIADLSEKYNILQSAMASSERIFSLLDTKPEVTSPEVPAPAPAGITAAVEFENVWFGYEPGNPVLREVSFEVGRGESLAIVGHTGAGKTTITSLMTRFYDIQRGRILVDGLDVRRYDLTTLRRKFAVVLQDAFLFSGTVESNIRLGSDIDPAKLVRAVQDVGLAPHLARLEGGLGHPVNERGTTLSGGQRQLIAFARALAHDPEILILDEATSSVDTETERQIRRGIHRLIEGRTSIVIAHRLSTIQSCDRILVLHKGKVREIGTHQELLGARGLYFKLYQLQYRDQELAGSLEEVR
jgi:ATP-binding cassette subfamily B protein